MLTSSYSRFLCFDTTRLLHQHTSPMPPHHWPHLLQSTHQTRPLTLAMKWMAYRSPRSSLRLAHSAIAGKCQAAELLLSNRILDHMSFALTTEQRLRSSSDEWTHLPAARLMSFVAQCFVCMHACMHVFPRPFDTAVLQRNSQSSTTHNARSSHAERVSHELIRLVRLTRLAKTKT
jgi:hypothetical protein